jgi:hypothetical protein
VTLAGSRRFLAAAAVFASLVLPGTVSSAHAASAPDGIAALRICNGCAQAGGDLSRYRYVVLNSWDAPLLPALKAANPDLKALVYKNLTFTVSYGCQNGSDLPYQTTGVGYCDAGSQHPEWFLADPSGSRLNSSPYPSAWVMDVGNPAYQAKWLSNVLADARSGGWDGVFMDDTNADMGFHLSGRTIAKYPTSASWRAATRSMLATVGPALKAAGLLAVPNLYTPWMADYDAQATWSDWIKLTSGAAQEYYSKWGSTSSGHFAGSDWTFRQQFQALTEQAGKVFLGITYAPTGDARSMAWARANFLLFDDPVNKGALIFQFSDPEAQDPFAPGWTTDVGTPVGARFQVGAAWRRNFTGGTVVVNPSASPVTVELGQAYLRADGTSATAVTLGPTSGAVLRSSPGASAQPPPPPPVVPPSAPTLTGSAGGTKVLLHWTGLSGSRVDILRNGGVKATVANSGSYTDDLARKPKQSYSYRVCVAGTKTCTPTINVVVGTSTKTRKALSRAGLRIARLERASARRHVYRARRR